MVLPIKLKQLKFIPAEGGLRSGQETLEAILDSQESYMEGSLIEGIHYHESCEEMVRGLKVWKDGKILFNPHDQLADWEDSSQQMSSKLS